MKRIIEVVLGFVMLAILVVMFFSPGLLPDTRNNLAVGCGGELLVASSDGRITSVGLFEAPDDRMLAAGQVPRDARGLATSRDGTRAFLWTDHYACTLDRDGPDVHETEVWQSEDPILQVIEVHPHSIDGPRLLALSAEDTSGDHPLGSHLTLVDPSGEEAAREVLPDTSGYNFWRASAGDVDGDGAEDLSLCTWSHTALDEETKRRFFIYSWNEAGELYPRWRGSRLSRPYVSAELAQVLPNDRMELVSVERGLNGKRLLVAYEWNQFGFWGLGHSAGNDRVSFVDSADVSGDEAPELLAVVRDHAQPRRVVAFAHRDGAPCPRTGRDRALPGRPDLLLPRQLRLRCRQLRRQRGMDTARTREPGRRLGLRGRPGADQRLPLHGREMTVNSARVSDSTAPVLCADRGTCGRTCQSSGREPCGSPVRGRRVHSRTTGERT